MGARVAATSGSGGSHIGRKVLVASGSPRAVHERGVHAHRPGQFLSLERYRAADACRDQVELEKTVTAKPEVIDWLKRSLDAVKTAHANIRPADLQRKVKIEGRDATVDGMYLRIIIHDNDHMGQLVAYARVNGIVPPWSHTTK